MDARSSERLDSRPKSGLSAGATLHRRTARSRCFSGRPGATGPLAATPSPAPIVSTLRRQRSWRYLIDRHGSEARDRAHRARVGRTDRAVARRVRGDEDLASPWPLWHACVARAPSRLAGGPTPRGRVASSRRTPEGGRGDCSSCSTALAPRSGASGPPVSVLGLGRVAPLSSPRARRTGTTAGGPLEVAMIDQASTWWFSADRSWHKGQPPPGWWQGPDRYWRPPTEAPAARPGQPVAPPSAAGAGAVDATAGHGMAHPRPADGQPALHLKESPRRWWSRRPRR